MDRAGNCHPSYSLPSGFARCVLGHTLDYVNEARTFEAEAEAGTLEAEAKTLEAEARTLEAKAEARTLEAKAEAIQFWPSKFNKF